jgi:transposase InsO family protein
MKKPDKYADAKAGITEIYHKHKGRYGYRRITLELRKLGFLINHKAVQRLMGCLGLKSVVRIKKYKSYRGSVGKIAPNLLERDFSVTKPYTKWVTDVTQFMLFGQKLYLSPILDLYNGEIISYSISKHPTFHQTMDMLNKAFEKIPNDTGLILHSDQGWQYQMKRYQHLLKEKGIVQSMSRKGNCLDNAPMESFFGSLKSELLYIQKFDSPDHFVNELHDYMIYYNNQRIKIKLKGLSPVEFRTQSFDAA